jgi:cytidylate kinase
VVTLDGPAGAGKSTLSRELARLLDWQLLDTGAMYRAVALAALRSLVPLDSDDRLTRLARSIEVEVLPGEILLDGEKVGQLIRTREVSGAASRVATCPGVRERLVDWQRAFGARYNTVTEGRDQGTVVFPYATRKFFVTASPRERALRRTEELEREGRPSPFETVLADIIERDERDRCRAVGPLRAASDALIVDTTGLSPERLVRLLLELVEADVIPDSDSPVWDGLACGLASDGRVTAIGRSAEDVQRAIDETLVPSVATAPPRGTP